MDRYAGKPFLKLLESFILSRIGRLYPDDAALLSEMTPRLQKTFGRAGAWDEIIAAAMDFDDTIGESIRRDWTRWVAQHGDADPAAFARSLADAITKE